MTLAAGKLPPENNGVLVRVMRRHIKTLEWNYGTPRLGGAGQLDQIVKPIPGVLAKYLRKIGCPQANSACCS